jgi:hypothetical protein
MMERLTIKLTIILIQGDIQEHLTSDLSREQTMILTIISWWQSYGETDSVYTKKKKRKKGTYFTWRGSISGTCAAIWSKTNFGPTGPYHLKVVTFRAYAPFPALLPFFKCILEVIFCKGVQHC